MISECKASLNSLWGSLGVMFPRTLLPSVPCWSHVPLDNVIHLMVSAIYSFPQIFINYLLATNHCALHMELRHHISCSSPPGWPKIPENQSIQNMTFHLSLTSWLLFLTSFLVIGSINHPNWNHLRLPLTPTSNYPQVLWISGLNGSPSPLFSIPS